jgi:HSP20 family protein
MLPILRKTRSSWPNLFDEFFNNDYHPVFFDWDGGRSLPAVNITESKKDYRVEVAAPGLTRNDFKVNLDENVLTISSEKEVKNETREEDVLRREFSYSSFSRCFTLPETADADKIKASHKDGVLSITIPKKEVKNTPAKEIKVT